MPRALLCETVAGQTMAGLLAGRAAATAADMVEVRLDGVADLDVARAVAGAGRPVVATCRPAWEGGQFTGSERDRLQVLAQALTAGADYIDVEWQALHGSVRSAFADLVGRAPERVVVSSHDFEGVPADLTQRTRDMRGVGAAAIKVAVTPRRLADTLPLLDVARGGKAIVIGMGDAGVPTRLLASRFGSVWTYAGRGVAPGQIPAARMIDDFGFHRVSDTTRLFGVVSTNAMHSLSPVMHNAAFSATGIDAVYVPLHTADFGDFLEFAEAMGLEGASVTIPFKRDALRAASRADALARQVGAANTLSRVGAGPRADAGTAAAEGERLWEATNTDVDGFLDPLRSTFGDVRHARVAVLGGGGAARAVVVGLKASGAAVTVHTRRRDQALEVTEELGAEVGEWPVPPGSWDILVNCTPLGGASLRGESPLPGGPFTGRLVYDLTYGPGESALVREARAAGCVVLDGLPMLVAQAERQFTWWTGQPAPAGVMRRSAECRLAAAPVV